MAKFTFDKGAKKKMPKPITETKISKPKKTYDPVKTTKQVEADYQQQPKKKRPVGRPKSGRKIYQTVRLQKKTVLKINALENALSIPTQDATVDQAIERVINSLNADEKRSYELWLEMFKKKLKELGIMFSQQELILNIEKSSQLEKVLVPPIKIQGIKTKLLPFIRENIKVNKDATWFEPVSYTHLTLPTICSV